MSTRIDLPRPVRPALADDPTPPLALRVPAGALRCPYCHEGCAPAGSAVCQDCLARHHGECWDEAQACAACGSAARLITAAEAERSARIAARGWGVAPSERGETERARFLIRIPLVALPVLGAALFASTSRACVVLTGCAALTAGVGVLGSLLPWLRGCPGAGGVLIAHFLLWAVSSLCLLVSFDTVGAPGMPPALLLFGVVLLVACLGFAVLVPQLTTSGERPRG